MVSHPRPQSITVRHADIGGRLFFTGSGGQTIVLFNQWRSGADSLFSLHLAELLIADGYGSVLCIDRIASGGASRNSLSKDEKRNIKQIGDQLFAADYYQSIRNILASAGLAPDFYIGGSSLGAPAAFYTFLEAASLKDRHSKGLVLVEPGGMTQHGFGKRRRLQTSHALTKHVAAYRHRLKRGWWTPMDREQYFAKSPFTEYRARFSASDTVKQHLVVALQDSKLPIIQVTFSDHSHIHTKHLPAELQDLAAPPHRIRIIPGSHDHACQPRSLHSEYSLLIKSGAA